MSAPPQESQGLSGRLVEALEAARGHVAEVERGRPEAADGAAASEEVAEQRDEFVADLGLLDGVGEAGHQQAVEDAVGVGARQWARH